MKIILLSVALILSVHGLTDKEHWVSFRQQFGRRYSNLAEEKLRFQIFQDNLKKIKAHNEKYENGQSTFYLGVNKFADMTKEEFNDMLLLQVPNKPDLNDLPELKLEDADVPDSINWKDKGAVLSVKNQGTCGSCWSFSTTGTIEGQNFLVNNVSIPLSEQELMDCSILYGNNGCSGGNMVFALDYVIDNGIHSEQAYPYKAESGNKCKKIENDYVVRIKSYKRIADSDNDLKIAIGECNIHKNFLTKI